MKNPAISVHPDHSKWGPIQIASGYLLLGALWILFSDKLAAQIAPNTEAFSRISIYKGWGYVLVTALLLYWLIGRNARNIRDANQKYKLLAENASDVIWLMDPIKSMFTYISPSILKLRGYTAEEVMVQPLNEAFLPEDVERLSRLTTDRMLLFKAKGSGTVSYVDEIDQPRRDGSVVHTEVTTTYFFNDQNEIEIMGVTRDITRRKQAEIKQRASEKKYQDLLEQASDGIFIADPSGRYTLVNEQACRLVGYSKDELLSMNMHELVAPEELEATPLRFDELRTGKTLITERKILCKDESRTMCEISSKMLPDGSYQSIMRDITERKVTEDALVRSEKRYRSLFENMPNGYARCQILYDEQGRPIDFMYTDVNMSFKRLTGLQDVIGRRVSEVIPGIHETNPELLELYGRVASTGKPEKFETYVPELESGIWFSVSAYSFERGFFVAVFETITERKRAEESLQRNYRQLLSFIDHAPLSIIMLDRDMNYLAVSRRWIQEFGRGYTDLIGRNHYEVHPDLPDSWKKTHQRGLAGESLKNDDDLWVQADGTKFWLRWALTPWMDNEGKIGGIIISSEDISERKWAEEQLQENERRYRELVQNANSAILRWNHDGTITFFNEYAQSLFGYTPQEILGKDVNILVPKTESTGGDLSGLVENIVESPEQFVNIVNENICRDGHRVWMTWTNRPLYDENGEVSEILAVGVDITERKQAEEAIARLAKFPSENPNPVMRVDMNGTLLYANPASTPFLNVWGIQMGQCVPPNWVEIITAVQQTRRIQEIEVDLHGHTYTCSFTPIPEAAYINIYGNDITERKRAEEQVQYQANLLSHVSDAVFSTDEKQVIVSWNRAAEEMYGWSAEEAIGNPIGSMIQSDFTDIQRADAIKTLTETGRFKIELLQHHRNGEPLWVDGDTIALTDQAGKITGFVAVNRNITDRKLAEEEIRRLNEDLEARVIERTSQLAAANKELESFSYSVSHDLRAPLRAIDGYTNILMEDYKTILDAEGRRVCNVISQESKRMGRLIDDLLSFSRMGRRELHFQHIDMKGLVDSVLDNLLNLNDKSRIELRVADLHPAMGDNALMRQVWVNLLSNAIKFTSKKERAIIQVESVESEEGVTYSVRDNGAGFEMEYVNKLFGVFQRLHSESEFEGTGVGLAIVQRVIQRHGGYIWAEGKVDEGATVRFLLPKRSDQT